MEQKFFFIAGCARSGTSALAQLLGSNDNVVMGMERFGHLVQPDTFSLTKEHFTSERFSNIEPEDTFYTDFNKFHAFDKNIKEKLNTSKYIGDKRPDLYESYEQLFTNFTNAKLLFIYRDIFEVASSYNVRVQNKDDWPADKDYKKAVVEWNRSLYLTREAIDSGYDIKVIDYKSLFINCENITPILDWLDITMDHNLWLSLNNIIERSKTLQNERVLHLNSEQIDYIKANAKFHLIDDLSKARIIK